MRFARENGYIVFTHDLDFSTLLALTGDDGPSVVQMRTQDVMAATHHERVRRLLQHYAEKLRAGAILTIRRCAPARPHPANMQNALHRGRRRIRSGRLTSLYRLPVFQSVDIRADFGVGCDNPLHRNLQNPLHALFDLLDAQQAGANPLRQQETQQ